MYMTPFLNRQTAGRELGKALMPLIEGDAAVFGISEDGMAAAAEAARCLNALLYPLAVCRLGIPGHDNLSMGALAPQGVQWLDRGLIEHHGIAESVVREAVEKGIQELQRRSGICVCGKDLSRVAGGTAVIVDDGISNNIHNVLAAVEFVRRQGPRLLLIAAPVISARAIASLSNECKNLVYLYKPETYINTDYWYQQ